MLSLSADPAFGGDPSLANPEALLLAAASSCQLLSFLAVAARAGVDVRSYEDDADCRLPAHGTRLRLEGVVLRPHIVVGPGTDAGTVERLVHQAHQECYIANSLAVEVQVEPTVQVA